MHVVDKIYISNYFKCDLAFLEHFDLAKLVFHHLFLVLSELDAFAFFLCD